MKRILCIGAHVDDVELMVGGSIVKWIEMGFDVHYVAMSSADEINKKYNTREECYEATKCLGIEENNVLIYGFRTRYFYEVRQKLLDTLIWLRGRIKPDLVVVPSVKDKHQDHHVLARECLRAFAGCNMIAYKQPWNCKDSFVNDFIVLEKCHLMTKIEAITNYISQSSKKYTNQKYIEAMARFYGGIINVEYAEAFEIINFVDN